MTTTAAAAGTRRHTGNYPAEPRQVGIARTALAGWLGGGPQADEAVLVASEFATNAVLHSASRDGGAFTLRAVVGRDRLRIEVEDAGGPWQGGARGQDVPPGALTGGQPVPAPACHLLHLQRLQACPNSTALQSRPGHQ